MSCLAALREHLLGVCFLGLTFFRSFFFCRVLKIRPCAKTFSIAKKKKDLQKKEEKTAEIWATKKKLECDTNVHNYDRLQIHVTIPFDDSKNEQNSLFLFWCYCVAELLPQVV
jgi:hypothetical protein